jgi:hypothetical protein
VVFHLQQQSPPILPPLWQLFGDSPEEADAVCHPPWEPRSVQHALGLAWERCNAFKGMGEANSSSLDQLLAGFFSRFCQLLGGGAGTTG